MNLNTADAATLDTLPGVGPATAAKILDWRKRDLAEALEAQAVTVSVAGRLMLKRVRSFKVRSEADSVKRKELRKLHRNLTNK